MKHGIIWKDTIGKFNFYAWPTVAKLDNGVLCIVSSGFRIRHACPFGKAVIQYSYDNGKTWTNPTPIIDTPLDDRDAGICVKNNVVLVTSFNNTPDDQRGFITSRWTNYEHQHDLNKFALSYVDLVTEDEVDKYVGSTYTISKDGGYTFSKPKKSKHALCNPHGPTLLDNGKMMLVGRKYVDGGRKLSTEVCYAFSEDGESWSDLKILNVPRTGDALYCEPHLIQAKNGVIICHMRVDSYNSNFTIYQAVSKDGGETFSEFVPLKILGSPPHLMRHSTGTLICVYGRRVKPFGQRAIISFDNGKTWSHEIILRDDGFDSDLGYPSSVELADGKILTAYYHNTEDFNIGRSLEYTIWDLNEIKKRKEEEIFETY